MQINIKTINRAINRKFHRPLKDGCIYNISKLDNEKRTKHNETISLLKQAHETLINVEYLSLIHIYRLDGLRIK